ncbi:MAG: extracellular solute-binding protein [Candidatus Riflebacteria bacterium]|nr:extracellular solute-binding protein [Candidatus Riflebacteria bacterium]
MAIDRPVPKSPAQRPGPARALPCSWEGPFVASRVATLFGPALVLLALVLGCGGPAGPELWIYTSLYQSTLDSLVPQVDRALPGVAVHWYKAGSEEVAARVTAELAAGAARADVVMTADAFWYESLKQEGHLDRLPDDVLNAVPPRFRDPEGRYLVNRAAVMVMAFNRKLIPPDRAPRRFKDLASSEWKGKLAIGDPLKSGTHFVTVALLSRRYGWDYYKALRANGTIVEGGNSAIQRRVEVGDRPVGVLLYENLLKARTTRSPAQVVIPEDGAIVIPAPIAISAGSRQIEQARRFCRYMLGPQGQQAMADGYMYPTVEGAAGPVGGVAFQELLKTGLCPDAGQIKEIAATSEEIKETFVKVMFE